MNNELHEEQKKFFSLIINDNNQSVFFTGCAGTGKTFLLKKLIEHYQTYTNKCVYVTASTGIAASHIGGTTIYSFAGIGQGKFPNPWIALALAKRKRSRQWKEGDILFIDEISMVDADLFELLDFIGRRIRGEDNYELYKKPFGGLRLIITGDFYQLPPISTKKQKEITDNKNNIINNNNECFRYCFESNLWKEHITIQYELRYIHRQKDEKFIRLLNKIRKLGSYIDEETEEQIESMMRPLENLPEEIVPTKLYCTNIDVERENTKQLKKLKDKEIKIYEMGEEFENEDYRKQLKDSCLAEQILRLKKGAQVMLIRNLDVEKGLVNGRIGIVKDFDSENDFYPIVHFSNGITMTIEPITWNLFDYELLISKKQTKKRYQNGEYKNTNIKNNDNNDYTELEIKASCTQLPLKLAWAITIHKSQGMTIDYLQIRLDNAFEKGQVYVALSRGISMNQIQILTFDRQKIKND